MAGKKEKVSKEGMKQISMLSGKDASGKQLAGGKSNSGSSWDAKGKIKNPQTSSPIKSRYSTTAPEKHSEIAQPKLSANNTKKVAEAKAKLKKIK